jgi:hypothetical protein
MSLRIADRMPGASRDVLAARAALTAIVRSLAGILAGPCSQAWYCWRQGTGRAEAA